MCTTYNVQRDPETFWRFVDDVCTREQLGTTPNMMMPEKRDLILALLSEHKILFKICISSGAGLRSFL